MEPMKDDENNVLLLKDIMDMEDQQCALEVYSMRNNDEFETLPDFPDEIHIDMNMYHEEFPYNFEELTSVPKRVTAANQVLPLFKSVYEDRTQEEEISLANEWQEVFQSLSTGAVRDHCKCLLCKSFFVTPSKLLNHVIVCHAHLGLRELQHCYVCSQRFVFPKALSLHLERHHGLLAPHLTCSVCFTQLSSQSELKAHMRKHSLIESCQFCYSHFPSKQQLAQHLASVHVKQFPCSFCRRSFDHKAAFNAHLARHKSFSTAPCDHCKWRPGQHLIDPELAKLEHLHAFHTSEQLQFFFDTIVEEDKNELEFELLLKNYEETSEMVLNHGSAESLCLEAIVSSVEKVVGEPKRTAGVGSQVSRLCKLCTKEVRSLDEIQEHVQECHPQSKQCPICKSRFPTVKRAQRHTRLHLKTEPEPKIFNCQFCDLEFKDTGKLNRHLENAHKFNVLVRPFSCSVCNKSFQLKAIRDKHLATHQALATVNKEVDVSLKCKFCSCIFIKSSYLSKHIEKYHSSVPLSAEGRATFECEHCKEHISDLSKLKRHMVYRHGAASDKCRFKCNLCNVSCRTAVGLKVHMRTHTKLKPNECRVCGKGFNRTHALNLHMQRVHSVKTNVKQSKKMYLCAHSGCCHRQSTHAAILKHFLRAHRDVKRFICGLCGECYSQNQELKIHMRSKHNLTAPSICVKESNKQTDIHVFPSVEKLPASHPHAMLITQIYEDQLKKTLNLPEFQAVEETGKPEPFETGEQKSDEAKQSQEVPPNETIIYDTDRYQTAFPDLEAIAAPNTLTAANKESYLSIISQAYEKLSPQYPEMVAAVVNLPPKEHEFTISQPIVISTNTQKSILTSPNHLATLASQAEADMLEALSCEMCNITFNSSDEYTNHLRRHSNLSCSVCHKTFDDEIMLDEHKKVHQLSKRSIYLCPHCPDRLFKRASDLQRHLKSHQENRSYQCDLCGIGFTRKDTLLVHHTRKHGQQSFNCETCGKIFKLENQFKDHVKTHAAKKEHKCEICGRLFTMRSYLKSHLKRHEKQKDYIPCPSCPRKFSSEKTMQVHKKSFHTKGAMLLSRQQKQEAQRQEEAQKATLAASLEDEMLQVDYYLEDSQVVCLKVLSDADLEFLPS